MLLNCWCVLFTEPWIHRVRLWALECRYFAAHTRTHASLVFFYCELTTTPPRMRWLEFVRRWTRVPRLTQPSGKTSHNCDAGTKYLTPLLLQPCVGWCNAAGAA